MKIPEGYKLYLADYMPERHYESRTWRQRLFSWPWAPHKSFKDCGAYVLINHPLKMIIMNPHTAKQVVCA